MSIYITSEHCERRRSFESDSRAHLAGDAVLEQGSWSSNAAECAMPREGSVNEIANAWSVRETIVHSVALRARANAAISHATVLCANWRALRTDARRTVASSDFGQRASGRIIVASPAPRAHADAARHDDGSDGDGTRPAQRDAKELLWASALVYASRAIPSPRPGPLSGSWIIRELDTRTIPGARDQRCLVFENEAMVRRLWTYPSDWTNLTDAALLKLVEGNA